MAKDRIEWNGIKFRESFILTPFHFIPLPRFPFCLQFQFGFFCLLEKFGLFSFVNYNELTEMFRWKLPFYFSGVELVLSSTNKNNQGDK